MTPEEKAKRLKDLVSHAANKAKQAGRLLEDLAEVINWAEKAVDRLSEALKEVDPDLEKPCYKQANCWISGIHPGNVVHCSCWYEDEGCCACAFKKGQPHG